MAASLSMPAASTQYIYIPVISTGDLTGDTVEVAFLTTQVDPVDSDWHAAAWQSGASPQTVQFLVGPVSPGLALSAATYFVWVRVTASPEKPVMLAGTLQLT